QPKVATRLFVAKQQSHLSDP
ncbi:hypothetical protein D046_0811B, partial [Vibrio parahaemolyticus V-223/04]